jgi:hypothetical protein
MTSCRVRPDLPAFSYELSAGTGCRTFMRCAAATAQFKRHALLCRRYLKTDQRVQADRPFEYASAATSR